MRFELQHLESYDDESLLNEIRRVAALLHNGPLTKNEFVKYVKVHSSTIERRFGSWRNALRAAGLSEKLDRGNIPKTKDEIVEAIQNVAKMLNKNSITLHEFEANWDNWWTCSPCIWLMGRSFEGRGDAAVITR